VCTTISTTVIVTVVIATTVQITSYITLLALVLRILSSLEDKSGLHSRGVFVYGVRVTYDTDVDRFFPQHTSSLSFTFPNSNSRHDLPVFLTWVGVHHDLHRRDRHHRDRHRRDRHRRPDHAIHNPGEERYGVGISIKDMKDKKTGFLSFSI
jgi:hypothetical protein